MAHTIEDVVQRGMCVGCGACSVATSGAIPVTIGTRQAFEANLENVSAANIRLGSRVCPFSDESKNEDEISAKVFPPEMAGDERLGNYTGVFAGRLSDVERLAGSSSGGLTSWVALKLLDAGHVDGVIHVGTESSSGALFSYQVSRTPDELLATRKSNYYASSFSEAIQSIRGDGLNYAFVGVPCFVRAARLLSDEDAVLAGQLKFFLGLVCGHLKSFGFAESLAWQVGVPPEELDSVDFRVKVPGESSSNYNFGARALGATELLTAPTGALVGGNWGHGMFQLDACNFCDDIFAETADVAFGDAWLPEYKKDSRGTNVIVSRNALIDDILRGGQAAGEVTLDVLSVDSAALSQAGNFRHRRDGLSLRLSDDLAVGLSVPLKRVAPGSRHVSRGRARIVRLRREMSEVSETAFLEAKSLGSIEHFLGRMKPYLDRYAKAETSNRPFLSRVKGRLRKMLG